MEKFFMKIPYIFVVNELSVFTVHKFEDYHIHQRGCTGLNKQGYNKVS